MDSDKNRVKLNYYQVMSFMFEIHELKRNNSFKDEVIDNFFDYVFERTYVITREFSRVPKSILKKMKLYSVSYELYNYLSTIIGIDVLDKSVMSGYNRLLNVYDKATSHFGLVRMNDSNNLVKRRVKVE